MLTKKYPSTTRIVGIVLRSYIPNSGGLDFAVDVYPYYGSDAEAGLKAGYDVRHGLIGSGVYASHGYERSHIEGVKNTFLLLKGYLG